MPSRRESPGLHHIGATSATVWDLYTLQQIYALERVQRQAAKIVTSDYSSRDPGSVTRMLQQLQWDTLEERRARSRSIMLYRILNNLVEVPLHQYIQINTTRTRGSCAHNIRQISTRVDAYKYSFLPRTIVACYHQSCEASQQLNRSGITYLPSVCLDSSATCKQDQLLLTINRDILIVHTRVKFVCFILNY